LSHPGPGLEELIFPFFDKLNVKPFFTLNGKQRDNSKTIVEYIPTAIINSKKYCQYVGRDISNICRSMFCLKYEMI